MPAFFRLLTLMGLQHFVDERVDWAVVEVGIGGRTDATNIFPDGVVQATGITSIGLDHQEVLGETLAEIAAEEAGICRHGVPALTAAQQPSDALTAIRATAAARGARLRVAELTLLPRDAVLGLAGEHQHLNAALALALVAEAAQRPTPNACDLQALAATRWPGRAQRIAMADQPAVQLLLDGAHTPESAAAAAAWFTTQLPPGTPAALLFYCRPNRRPDALLAPLVSLARHSHMQPHPFRVIFATEPAEPDLKWQRQLAYHWQHKLQAPGDVQLAVGVVQALEMLAKQQQQHQQHPLHVLVTGSLYLVGAVLKEQKFSELYIYVSKMRSASGEKSNSR